MKAIAQKQSTPPKAGQVHQSRPARRDLGNQRALAETAPASAGDVGSAITYPATFAHDFSQVPVFASAPLGPQASLKVGAPGDVYEQEADRLSEQVMGMTEPRLQRDCACGGIRPGCRGGQDGRVRLQSSGVHADDAVEAEPSPFVSEVLRSPGQPLDAHTRAFMESRFGHDFSRVRVHADKKAAESAESLRARAYTVGQHIAFGPGQYHPHAHEGRRLIAHELTHTLQQQAAAGRGDQPTSPFENATDRVRAAAPMLQRQSRPDAVPPRSDPEPSAAALKTLAKFSNRANDPRVTSIDCSEVELRESHRPNANVETIRGVKMAGYNISWTYKVVWITEGNTDCYFLRASQDGTSVVNCYQRCDVGRVKIAFVDSDLDTSIFKQGSAQFDFTAPTFSKFYKDLDEAFSTMSPDIFGLKFVITMGGENNALNAARANAIKDDLVKRKMNKNRISIQFSGKAGSTAIKIFAT